MVCYTKDGPEEDSYIVFLCFDIKLKDFLKVETLVPDIQCLYVTPKNEDGSRYIRYSNVEEDEELQAYVRSGSKGTICGYAKPLSGSTGER